MSDTFAVEGRLLSPTDLSQFLRLGRCERFLRLKVVERLRGPGFLHEFGVAPQTVSPVLERAGREFEGTVSDALRLHFRVLPSLEDAARLAPGEAAVVFQPRLEGTLGRWRVTGDADLIQFAREDDGTLRALIVDVKSSEKPRVEYRLQVALYAALLAQRVPPSRIETGILYRGPGRPEERAAAEAVLGLDAGYLERGEDAGVWQAEVEALLADEGIAERVAAQPFDTLFFALGTKCDGCRYGEFCLKRAHVDGDLSLVPYLPARDKKALLAAGVRSARELATLKNLDGETLTPALGAEPTLRRLAATSAGPRIDELVLRARKTRGVDLPTLASIPSKGHTTLPYTAPDHNPNLVVLYLDVQFDPTVSRAYLAGARIVAHENGVPARARAVVHLSPNLSATPEDEARLFAGWAQATLAAVAQLAAPDDAGERKAPLHLVFWNDYGETALLDALARNLGAMTGAVPALYDLMTQTAAYDSPLATFLADELKERKNYPVLCASLHNVATYLKFDWGEFRRRFYEGVFDTGGQDEEAGRFSRRSRHGSQIPLEYARGAVSREELIAFQERRLEAIAHIAAQFVPNDKTTKTAFDLSSLSAPPPADTTLAGALAEFLAIERHTFLAGWRDTRQIAPERRVLLGETLRVRYLEADQDLEVAAQNRENARRKALQDIWRAENPGKQLRGDLAKELRWSVEGLRLRLRLDLEGIDADLATALGLLSLKEGDFVVLSPRWTVDERLPEAERREFAPTPKQLLYGMRARIERLPGADDPVVEVTLGGGMSTNLAGFAFRSVPRPLEEGALYTLDPSPDDLHGYRQKKTIDALAALERDGQAGRHALYGWLTGSRPPQPSLSPRGFDEPSDAGKAARGGGFDAFRDAGLLHDFEPGKRDYIGGHGDDPVLLVQGPPGTGKSYTTAFAVLARVQAALARGETCRVFLCCKTHSATDVLLRGVADGLATLARLREARPDLFAAHFDSRLLELPLLRLEKGEKLPETVARVPSDSAATLATIRGNDWVAVAGTPGGIYKLLDKQAKTLTGTALCDLLVLDEASQMSLPEAMMAALPLSPSGQLLVVGDPRQMPPIVQHDWEAPHASRTFQQHPAYRSLYETLAARGVPTIRFEESFRLHTAMASFLREEIYLRDGIHFHSRKTATLPARSFADPLLAAVLDPAHPIVVVVHAEASSQTRNPFEERLIGPILRALAGEYGLSAAAGLGVVVPHRAQRAALLQACPEICVLDDEGRVVVSAVDTVERYQGDEREVIILSATESDPEFLQASAGFLLDPRRLNVALSRAKKKVIVVAARTLFDLFPTDDELFGHAQIWKNLLRRACPQTLWKGAVDGVAVEVRGQAIRGGG